MHYVVVKRRNAGIEKAWVVQDLTQWLKEKAIPVPEGELTTAEIWSDPNGVNDQTVEETEASEVQEEADATEQAVVESGSETEG